MLGLSGHFDGNRVVPNPETALVIGWVGGAILAFLVALTVAAAVEARRVAASRRRAAARATGAGLAGSLVFGLAGSLSWIVVRLVVPYELEGAFFLAMPALVVGLLVPFLGLGAALVAAFPRPGADPPW
jgi:hypothetical protein